MEDNKAIQEELVTLRRLRDITDERIKQLESQQAYRIGIKIKNNGSLYKGVLASSLKPYIQEWIDQGFTLVALADKAGVSESTVSKILNNERDMVYVSTADRIISALGITHLYDDIVPQPPESQYYEE